MTGEPAHIVISRFDWLNRLVGRAPRTACGVSLAVPKGEPDPVVSDDLVCADCALLAGWSYPLVNVEAQL